MVQRCTNPNNIGFADYQGRGITMDERWMVFANFLADMGERPDGTSLDRIDNDGPYEPGNCRWATQSEQNRNQRPRAPKTVCKHGHALIGDNVYLLKNGKRLCLKCKRARGRETDRKSRQK
jgi:hypothetical protein